MLGWAALVCVMALIGLAGTNAVRDGGDRETVPADVQESAQAQLENGLYVGQPPWPPEYSALDERVATLDLPGGLGESYHVHVLLSVFVDGEQVDVPSDIGIPSGGGHVPLHTHTPDGVIHVEAPKKHPYTIGDIFTVWGVTFTDDTLGGNSSSSSKPLSVYVNGELLERDAPEYVFKEGDNIVVGYGAPESFPEEPDASALDDA